MKMLTPIRPVTASVTHHHGDQVQGLARAAAAGVRIWVPPVERALIEDADRYWRTASSRTTTTSVKIGRGAKGGSGSRSRSRRTTR